MKMHKKTNKEPNKMKTGETINRFKLPYVAVKYFSLYGNSVTWVMTIDH